MEIQIRDPQGRWPKVARAYEAGGERFTTTITWDRRFSDGTLALPGTYDVVVKAFDRAGNLERAMGHILIPAPGVTPPPLPTRRVEPVKTRISQPQTTDNCPLMTDDCSLPVPAVTASNAFSLPALPLSPTRTPVVSAFQSSARQSPKLQSNNLQSNNRQSPAPLFGAAALAAIAAATAYALEQRRKRKDEEARQRAEAQAEAVGLSVPKPVPPQRRRGSPQSTGIPAGAATQSSAGTG